MIRSTDLARCLMWLWPTKPPYSGWTQIGGILPFMYSIRKPMNFNAWLVGVTTRAEEIADHRSWKPGHGHVRAAFQMQREIVAGDTSAPEARALFNSSDVSRQESDRRRYRSIASLPIRLADEPVVGILVATSDIPQRFRLRRPNEPAMDPVEPLRILANALAFVMKTNDFHPRPDEVDK